MLKKFLIVLLLFGGIFSSNIINDSKAQEELQVSPSVWVKDSNAISEVTIHVAHPYAQSEGFILYIDGSPVDQSAAFPDNKGDLVIKFVPDMSLYSVDEKHLIKVVIDLNFWETTFSVKEISEPPSSQGDVDILEGDKVRGSEGVGQVNQNQTEEPKCWDTSWCEPDGSFGD